jgi:DNA-binding transcriptional LysR family regulator
MSMLFSQLPELRHLRCFVTVAEERSFSRASVKLRISQQQVSRTIQSLEELIGAPLFERTTRQVRMSSAGDVFFPSALEALDRLEASIRRTRQIVTGKLGRLTIAFSSFAMESSLPEILQRYRREHPSIGLELHEMSASRQEEALLNKTIDAGFSVSPSLSEELHSSVLARCPFVLAVPASSEWRGPCDLASLRQELFLMLDKPSSPGYNETVHRVYQEAGFVPRHAQKGQSLSALLSLVSSGAGVVLAPEFVMQHQRSGVRFVPVRTNIQADLVCTSRRDSQSIALHALKKLAQESIARSTGNTVGAARKHA